MKIFILILLFSLFALPAFAQADLEPGQTVTGEITDESYEQPYTFIGKSGDIIVLEMRAVEAMGSMDEPLLILQDSTGDLIADTTDVATFGQVRMALALPANDMYTVIASRVDGSTGASTGEYNLTLHNLTALTADTTLTGTISSEDMAQYYLVLQGDEAQCLDYVKAEGDFAPQMTVYTLGDNNQLDDVVILAGRELRSGTVNLPETEGAYIITLDEALFDFNFGTVTADYSLTLRSADDAESCAR